MKNQTNENNFWISDLDVVHLVLHALSLIDGDISKLSDILSSGKVNGYNVKNESVEGTMSLTVEGDAQHLNALYIALEEARVETDIQTVSNEKMSISCLYTPLPNHFETLLENCYDRTSNKDEIYNGNKNR